MSKLDYKTFLLKLLLVTVIISVISLATTYFILYRNIQHKLSDLDRSAQLIAGQINSANLNSILAFTNDFYIFIVHERDGRILFESAKRPPEDLAIWEAHRETILPALMEKKEGWLTYPETEQWKILNTEKRLRYLHLPELDWIVAVELPSRVTVADLKVLYSPVILGILLPACFIITLLLFPMKEREEQPKPVVYKKKNIPSKETQKLVAEARKVLEEPKKEEEKPAPVEKLESEPLKVMKEEKKEKKVKEVVKKQDQPKPIKEKQPAKDIKEEKKDEEKKAEEVQTAEYFEKIVEKKPSSGKKPQPTSIIGIALSKKSNREKIDS